MGNMCAEYSVTYLRYIRTTIIRKQKSIVEISVNDLNLMILDGLFSYRIDVIVYNTKSHSNIQIISFKCQFY